MILLSEETLILVDNYICGREDHHDHRKVRPNRPGITLGVSRGQVRKHLNAADQR